MTHRPPIRTGEPAHVAAIMGDHRYWPEGEPMPIRKCRDCGEDLPFVEFRFASRATGARRSDCVACERERQRKKAAENYVPAARRGAHPHGSAQYERYFRERVQCELATLGFTGETAPDYIVERITLRARHDWEREHDCKIGAGKTHGGKMAMRDRKKWGNGDAE